MQEPSSRDAVAHLGTATRMLPLRSKDVATPFHGDGGKWRPVAFPEKS